VFEWGKSILLRDGNDLTLISTGGVLEMVVGAADRLMQQGVSVRVLSMPTVAPLDEAAIIAAGQETSRVITIEEHGQGGLASAVAEVLASRRTGCQFVPLRLRRDATHIAGSQEYLRSRQGLSVEGIMAAAQDRI
jgi:transketolase